MSTSDAVAREAAWLQTSGDGLPALLSSAGGPFDVVQAYWPRTPRRRGTGIYVLRDRLREERSANVRRMPHYAFVLRVIWPVSTSTGADETEQQNLDNAIDLVLQRVGGLLLDKTHGGRFLSVAEDPRYVDVEFDDPEQSLARMPAAFEARVRYEADDFESNG